MKLAVIFNRFGPYHAARLEAAGALFRRHDGSVCGIELTGQDATYGWRVNPDARNYTRVTLHATPVPGRRLIGSLRASLERVAPDAVAVPGWYLPAARAAARWCARQGVPAILMSDSTADDRPRVFWKEWIKRRHLRRFRSALVAGAPHREYVTRLGLAADKIHLGLDVVDNGYFSNEADAARQKAEHWRRTYDLPPRYFLAVSRLSPEKNLDTLLRAYRLYGDRARGDAWPLVLCGAGPRQDALRLLASSLGLTDRLRWAGFVEIDALPRYYGLASALVLPSHSDSWGLVVNEAAACGLPVIVSRRCGCHLHLVRDGANGWLVEPDDADGIADRLLGISRLSDRERRDMGEVSRALVAEWPLEKFAQGLLAAARDATRDPAGAA